MRSNVNTHVLTSCRGLAYAARPSTQDVDGLFRPVRQVREAAARVALQAGVSRDWLNDGVRGFLSERGEFSLFLELDHLRVMVAQPARRAAAQAGLIGLLVPGWGLRET